MKILLFEWLTGGGLWSDGQAPAQSPVLVEQGAGMLAEVGIDLLSAGHEIILPVDERLTHHPTILRLTNSGSSTSLDLIGVPNPDTLTTSGFTALSKHLLDLAEQANAALVIAPETGQRLLRITRELEFSGCRLLCPGSELVALTGDKNQLGQRLVADGFSAIPQGRPLVDFLDVGQLGPGSNFPCVVKPSDGAGSECVELLRSRDELEHWLQRCGSSLDRWRIEEYAPGLPVSVSVVGSDSGAVHVLPPMVQKFDAAPLGHWIGGSHVRDRTLVSRAMRQVESVLPYLPTWTGYAGFDLVIGDAPDRDVLIEVNPRLTMSYIEHRRRGSFSLGSLLMDSE